MFTLNSTILLKHINTCRFMNNSINKKEILYLSRKKFPLIITSNCHDSPIELIFNEIAKSNQGTPCL